MVNAGMSGTCVHCYITFFLVMFEIMVKIFKNQKIYQQKEHMYKGVQRPEKGSDTVKFPLHHSITHTVPRSQIQ